MPEQQPPGKRGSEVLDAIWDKVADKPQHSESAQVLFRAKALEQLDVAAEVDNQLPLVSRRNWLLLVGVAVLVIGLLVWASLTPSVTSVSAAGRVVASPGALPVVAAQPGILLRTNVETGQQVTAGQTVATLSNGDADAAVTSLDAGTVWQVLAVPGEAVGPAEPIITLLPAGSDKSVLLALTEAQAGPVAPGMRADVAGMQGTVVSVGAALPAEDAALRTGLALPTGTTYRLVSVGLTGTLPPGTAVNGQVILSNETVLSRLVGPA